MYLIRFNHFCSKNTTNFQMNIHEHVRNMHTGEEGMGIDTKSEGYQPPTSRPNNRHRSTEEKTLKLI